MSFFRELWDSQDEQSRHGIIGFLSWIFIVLFFLLAPVGVLHLVIWGLETLPPQGVATAISEFVGSMTMLLLAFWSGSGGALLFYGLGPTAPSADADRFMTKMSRMALGGLMGIGAFAFFGSQGFAKFLYPDFPVEALATSTLSWSSTVLTSMLAGLQGPAIVQALGNGRRRLGGRASSEKALPDASATGTLPSDSSADENRE